MILPNLRRFLALSVIGSIALMQLLVLPALVGVLVDNAGMSDAGAGWAASANFLASAIVGLLLALRVHRINLRRVAKVALVVAIAADLASAATAGESAGFFAARILAGLALGAVYVSTVSAFARLDGFDRGFGLFVTLQFIISGLGLYVVPVYADAIGAVGLFSGFALLDLVALMLVRALPDARARVVGAGEGGGELRILLTLTTICTIVGFAVFEAANNAQFTYIERFGVSLEISDQQLGFALLIASLVGIPGAFSTVVVTQRFGAFRPLVFGLGISVVGLLILISAQSYPAYFLGSCCMGFAWAFCLPFIQTLLATIDRHGSAIAAGSSLSTFGSAFGPGLAALVVGGGRYGNVFLLSIALFGVALLAFVLAHQSGRAST